MLGFLQGFAYGLFLSCLPWFVIGMVNPRLALPTDPPRRWQVFARYGFVLPFVAMLLWLTSLWGGFNPTLAGWLAGLFAVAVELPVERGWRRWRARLETRRRNAQAERERAALERQEREAGVFVLDPARPPAGADDVVLGLAAAKQRLLALRRADLAILADRVYTRYARLLETLAEKFDRREITFERSRGMAAEVCRGAVDDLVQMSSLAGGVAGIDVEFVRRRLGLARLSRAEREALQGRLALVDDTERRLRELCARVEGALTVLDQAAVAVARVETERPQASLAADLALAELRRFADKAEQYGRRRDNQ